MTAPSETRPNPRTENDDTSQGVQQPRYGQPRNRQHLVKKPENPVEEAQLSGDGEQKSLASSKLHSRQANKNLNNSLSSTNSDVTVREECNTSSQLGGPSEGPSTSDAVEGSKLAYDKLKEELEGSQAEQESLRNEVVRLTTDLHDAQDHIFGLQARFKNITEIEAAAEYAELCASVEDWAQSRLNDVLDDRKVFNEKAFLVDHAESFLNFVSIAGREAFAIADTDEYNIIAAIMKFLCIEIFDQDFYCPVENGALEFIAGIERSMRSLEPRPDLSVCRGWRSQTMIALSNRPIFESQRERRAKFLTEELTKILQMFVPRAKKNELQSSIYDRIIKPALALAHKLHISVDKITVEWTRHNEMEHEDRKLHPPNLLEFSCADLLANGKLLKESAVRSPPNDILYIFDIFPGLVYSKVKADLYSEPRVLQKPKVLVAVMKDVSTSGLPKLAAAEEGTLLGWVYKKVKERYMRERSWLPGRR